MAKDDRLPPKTGKGQMGPEMMEEDPAIVGKLSQLAGMGEQTPMGGAGGNEEQSASLFMSGIQQLKQAADMNPALQPVVQEAFAVLQRGVQGMTGGGMPPGGGGGERRRPPKTERRQPEEEMGY